MEIIEYDKIYDEAIKDLLVELQEYLVEIDYFKLLKMCPEYREGVFKLNMDDVEKNDGKIYLAKQDNKIIGLVIGTVNERDEEDRLTNICDKTGSIIELVISKDIRGSGIGTMLTEKIEKYLKSIGCVRVTIEVYGPNKNALNFYNKNGYEIVEYYVTKRL